MHNQNNFPKTTALSHYLRTGRIISDLNVLEGKKLELRDLRIALFVYVKYKWGKPNDVLVDHYFFSSGTLDLVGRGLLSYVTRTRVFQEASKRFLEQVQSDLLYEADKLCGRSQEDYIMGREKFIKRFKKSFSDKQSINFTNEFFSLGDSLIEMKIFADVDVNCITRGVSITGKITYKINDWFRDALDIEDAVPGYQEYPLGKAYKIVADWSQPIGLSGRF